MANDEEREPQAYPAPTEVMARSMRAWNELVMASTDMAFGVVLRNWDYSRSLRGSSDQAVADAIKLQQRMNKEMQQAWDGYSSDIKDILDRGLK